MKYNDNGEYKDIYIKTFDTLPVGAEVDYDGNTVPDGWTQVNNVLWTNSSPNAEFNNQSVSLNDNINNYTYYEIIFSRTNGDFFISTGKIPTNKEAMLSTFRQYYYVRSASPYTTSITFGNSAKYNNYGSSTSSTDNNYLIPYMVLGYK